MSHERNMRFHVVAACYVLWFSRFYTLSNAELLILLGVIALVLICEAFNTAVEQSVNLSTDHYEERARIAKDVAAGAVLIAAVFAVITAAYLLWDLQAFSRMAAYFTDGFLHLFILLLSLCAAFAFIFLPDCNHSDSDEFRQKKNK